MFRFKKSYGFGRPLKERKLTYRFVGRNFVEPGWGVFECLQTGEYVDRKIKITPHTKKGNLVADGLRASVKRFYGVL